MTASIKNHVTSCHRDVTPAPEFEYFCRCCDKAGQTFKVKYTAVFALICI